MDWLNELAQNRDLPLLAAFALGLLTAVSPCPLATNISATAYIAKTLSNKKTVLLSGLLYTLGRMLSYTALASLIYFGASKFRIARLFQENGEKFVGPLMLLIGLMMLGVIKLNIFGKQGLTQTLAEKFKDRGILGALILGILFALAFCPYSGALFFAILIPLTVSAQEGLLLPVVFSAGTGLPVIFFAFVLAFSMEKLGRYFNAITRLEKIMRLISGFVFIMTGLYYLNIYLKIL